MLIIKQSNKMESYTDVQGREQIRGNEFTAHENNANGD